MTEVQAHYSQPEGPPQVIISDEHITNLQVREDSILLARVPIGMTAQQGQQVMDAIRQIVHKKTGLDPGILMVARDCDLASLDTEALDTLRAEIDATLQYKYSKQGGDGGN